LIGYITTCGGNTYRLPTLTGWNIDYTLSVPCDSFYAEFPYEPDMLAALEKTVRFTAYEDGEEQFYGVVDEYGISWSAGGRLARISGRGMAALLLDNESKAAEYQYPTASEIVKNHVTPYGIVCGSIHGFGGTAAYEVTSGSSQWKAARDFAAYYGGFEPRFTKTGDLIYSPWKDAGSSRVIDASTPVTDMEYRDNRYGIISEMLLVKRSSGDSQTVKNSGFIARGGQCRHVLYVPKSTAAARYTGEYQIKQSEKGKRALAITLPVIFAAFPFETVKVSRSDMGIYGEFIVTEAKNSFGENGETSELTMCEVET
jgi:hypothetical protein